LAGWDFNAIETSASAASSNDDFSESILIGELSASYSFNRLSRSFLTPSVESPRSCNANFNFSTFIFLISAFFRGVLFGLLTSLTDAKLSSSIISALGEAAGAEARGEVAGRRAVGDLECAEAKLSSRSEAAFGESSFNGTFGVGVFAGLFALETSSEIMI
jgi:hypothetical protein